ncbi:T9SS type A sorting domain-containing protein [Aureispira anguillae]|uniref:T9SS type A sorting domain-containing protein n=1 Tax=Aureispira anguillae TaxID=2864201 RepID=A0A916DP21_9BACT|nr:T9SS type A sorting domain-containing protein [Aureispira anguillae]BDS10254.1 T9SS type A sorting domain-containing protein [Aureispira anguillae]
MKTFLLLNLLWLIPLVGYSQCNGNQNLDLYWIGGNGDFNDISQWEVGSLGSGVHPCQLPRSTDNVFFMAAAFNGSGPITITINNNSSCKNMYWDNAILAADMPTISSVASVGLNLDIYGALELATNMDFKFAGQLRLRSQFNGIVPIRTNGQKLRLWNVQFDGSSTTIFELQDDFYVDDILEKNHSGTRQGLVLLNGGTWDTNEKTVRFDYFNSINTNIGRGLDISNSVINIHGSYPYAYHWRLNFNSGSGNYTIFDATGSKIHFQTYTGISWSKLFSGGMGLIYDTLVSEAPIHFRAGKQTFDYILLKDKASYSHDITLDVQDLYVNSGTQHTFFYQKDTLIVGDIHVLPGCDQFVTFNARLETWSTMVGVVRKKTPGTLTTDRFILSDMQCDTTGGRSYISNNSLSVGATDPWWTINPPTAGKDFYFRDRSGGQEWKDPNNWDIWNGVAFVPNSGGCLPSPIDDVYFDHLSFPNSSKLLLVDTLATCHDMHWLSTVATGASMRLNYILNSYGSIYLDANMTQINGTFWICHGADPDTISTQGVKIWLDMRLSKYSNYYIVGDHDANTIDFDGRFLYGLQKSTLQTNAIQMKLVFLYVYNRIMDSTQVHFGYTNGRFYDYGYDTLSYTGNTTFHLDATSPSGDVSIYPGTTPNIIGNCYAYFRNGRHEVQGDLTLNEKAAWYPTIHPSYYVEFEIAGSMALYQGNLTLTAGKSYIFSPNPISYLTVAGHLNAVGDCQNFIQFRTQNGNPVPITVNDVASSSIAYTYLQGWDNSGNTQLTTINSIDGGNNTNFNFGVSGSGVTYYWRADKNNPTDFVGNWDDAGHWTTNPASLVGDSSCIPTLLDSVIFDQLSFSPTSNGCIIGGYAFCKTLICKEDIALQSAGVASSAGFLYIAESFHLDHNMTNYSYFGGIYFVGSGDINTNGTTLYSHRVYFDNRNGTWNLQNDLNLDNSTNPAYGALYYYGGILNTNDYNIRASIWTTAYSRAPMTWNLGQSTIDIYGRTDWSSYVFGGAYMDSLQIDADSCIINLDNSVTANRNYKMASSAQIYPIHYNKVNFLDTDNRNNLYGLNATYRFIKFDGDMLIQHNFSCDSVWFSGGHFYYLNQNVILNLNAPHGKILTNAGPGAFVNLETYQTGQTSYIHKAYGDAFCLDYIKIKDNQATKDPLAAVPAAYQVIHSLLKFETGVNSDNVNGTATGIWDFSLPVLVNPTVTGDTLVDFCTFSNTQLVPIALVGNSPYNISYTWTDNLGNSGIQADTLVADDDGDDNTPFIYYATFSNTNAATVIYNLELTTFRCGEKTPPITTTIVANSPVPNILVAVDRNDTCTSFNDPRWLTFVEDIDDRPILSIQDQINTTETDSLGLLAIGVDFDATVQYWGTTPYLQRHWRIEPEHNHAANVRVYFTQEELDSLKAHTYHGQYGLPFSASTDIQVRKFDSGIIGVGPSSVLPHTVLSWNSSNNQPFSTTTDVIGIEFNTPSFSAFIIEPTNLALLATELVSFEATVTNKQAVRLNWRTEDEKDLIYCVVERSRDGFSFETIGKVQALNSQRDNNSYTFLDTKAYPAISYYRLRLVDKDGSVKYSPIRAVELDGVSLMRVFPVPASDQLTISLNSSSAASIQIELVDQLGRVLQRGSHSISVGQNTLKLDTQALSAGIYLLRLTNRQGQVQQRKFMVDQ